MVRRLLKRTAVESEKNVIVTRTRRSDTQGQKPVVDTSVEHVQELEYENLKLRIENAFFKELRRLRLEDEAKTRGLQKSSAVSENHSN